jgi:hypothetical protein
MAERKSGPVKPPVIDLEAREAGEAPAAGEASAEPKPRRVPGRGTGGRFTPAERIAEAAAVAEEALRVAEERETAGATSPAPDAQPAPPPPRPPARLAMPWSAISIAAAAGAVLGAGLTYLAANWIALPHQAPPFADPAPALSALDERAAGFDARLATAEATARDTRVSLDATLVQLDSGLSELRQSIADVEASIPAAQQPADLSAIEEELRTLEGRVNAIAAGASSADASALAENLVGIEESLATLGTQVTDLVTRLNTSETNVAALTLDVEAAKAAITAQNTTLGGAAIGPAVRLPLILSGLDSAFATGRTYEAELANLTALLPDLVVPKAVADGAVTGLPRPDAIALRFEAAIPDILAGRTGESTGDWAQDAVEWAKALLALRPAEETPGDTPEALVSQLEAAVERYDFQAAAAILGRLPEPMRFAAGDLGEAILAHAQASRFVIGLRAQALATTEAPN